MAFTIYTVSDPITISTALTSMAMFFGQDSWVGSALKTALLLSLIFILVKGVTREGLRLDVMLVQLLVVTAAFLPKTTVTIEQFDNAAPVRVVDGVPLAIAIPSSIAGSFAIYMTQKIEAVMTSVNGNYLSVSGDTGPFTPARMLMSITACAVDPLSCVDRNLAETMLLAGRYCGGDKLSNAKFGTARSVIAKFAEGLTKTGSTIIYDKNDPYQDGGGTGRPASCEEVADYLNGYATVVENASGPSYPGDPASAVFSETVLAKVNNADVKRYNARDQQDNGPPKTWEDRLEQINKITDSVRKIDNRAMANVLTLSIAESFKYDSGSSLGQSVSIKRDMGLFDWAKSEAQQSMLVSSTAPKFMDVLFFIFVAATPIVMFVVASNPASGMKVAGAYVLFGVWTQSWIPMMAIITAWYQTEITNFPPPDPAIGATAEYMSQFMRHVNTSTIAAGNMLQNAPYMMFAIMSGSMMALSTMISKAAPSGGGGGSVDPSTGQSGGGSASAGGGLGLSGSGGRINPVAQLGDMTGAVNAMRNGLASSTVGMSGSTGSVIAGLPSLESGGGLTTGANAVQEQSAAARSQLQQQQSKAVSDAMSLIESGGRSLSGGQMAQVLNQAGFQASFDAGTGILTSNVGSFDYKAGQTNQTASHIAGAIKAAIQSDKGALGKLAQLLTGLSASAEVSAGTSNQATNSVSAGQGQTQQAGNNAKQNRVVTTNDGMTAGSGTTGQDASQWQKLAQDAKQLANTFSDIATKTASLDKADKLSNSAATSNGASSKVNLAGADVADAYGAQMKRPENGGRASTSHGEAAERLAGALAGAIGGGAAMDQFRQNMAAYQARYDRENLASNALSKDQIAAAAAWSALNDMKNQGDPNQAITGLKGMAALAAKAGLHDISGDVNKLKEGMGLVQQVRDGLNKANENVGKPVAERIETGGAQAAKQEGQIKTEAPKTIQRGRGAAAAALGQARAGAAEVKQKGNEALRNEEKEVADALRQNTDPTILAEKAKAANKARPSVIARPGELTNPMTGRSSATGHQTPRDNVDNAPTQANAMARVQQADPHGYKPRTPKAKDEKPQPQSPDVAQRTMDLGGTQVSELGRTLGGATSEGFKTISQLTAEVGQVAAPLTGTPGAPGQPAGGGGGGSSTGGGLPTLGQPMRFGGAQGAPAGGGGSPQQASATPTTSKPNSGAPSATSGTGKPKMPGR